MNEPVSHSSHIVLIIMSLSNCVGLCLTCHTLHNSVILRSKFVCVLGVFSHHEQGLGTEHERMKWKIVLIKMQVISRISILKW